MAKRKIQTPEDIELEIQKKLSGEKAALEKAVRLGYIPKNPTRSFDIGQRVKYGSHLHVVISEKDDAGILYLLHIQYEIKADAKSYQRAESVFKRFWVSWTDILPYRESNIWKDIQQFRSREEMRLQFYQTTIGSFDSIVYHFGVDLNPDYQRGYVWGLEDKEKLIDSIFLGVDIGKFVFIQKEYGLDKHVYEILDGKQRLTAIMEFLQDRFRYNGFLFSELHPHDQSHIQTYSISVANVSNPTKEQIYRYFLRLNISGKPMAESQIEKVEKLLHDEVEKKMNETGS